MLSGEQPASPSGVVTFLFTDIEGSTRRWEADPGTMRVALETHDRVLREAVEVHQGSLFKHTGDGVCAAFASPRAAVDAAVAAQRALELPVRMGVVTGEAETRGADYSGTVLNRAARVMSSGHGGQILLDGATAGLITAIDLIELGPRRLRDIARPVELFQVRAPGLRSDFPPLKTVDPTPGNLQIPPTSFIGRRSELADLETALKAHRMVTLTGVGGVGKTRLALEVAACSANDFPDGVWVIELASVGDPAAVPEAAAAVLGITQQPGLTLGASVAAALEGRSRLLVFDNCEHVLDATADMVETIFAHSATVTILATSREGLRVADEQLWPVPSLDVDSSAATLFVERAAAVAPGVSLAETDDAVREICRRLDGIPLAIELASSRMQSMTVTEVRDRLDNRFRLLVGSRRGLERHQTLRHAVQWSYDLLDDAEKSLLARCSVFAGGFDLAGACAVSGCNDEFTTVDLLDSLVRKSLLMADRSTTRTRFSMLETIRQFAEEQLVASDAASDVRAEHAHHFAGCESDVLTLWDGPRQREAYEWFTIELANLRTAFRWAADHDDIDTAAAIASYAAFLGIWGIEQHEPVGWAEEMIEPAKAVAHHRLAQLYVMASQCSLAGRTDESIGYAESGQLAIESGRFDPVPHGAEVWLPGGYISKGQPERWVEWCRNVIARDSGPHTVARAGLVFAFNVIGSHEEAWSAAEGLLAAADATDNPQVGCIALLAYGIAQREADPVAAHDVLRRGLELAQRSGNRFAEAQLAASLSRLVAAHGAPVDAFDYLALAIRHYYDAGNFAPLGSPLVILAGVFARTGRPEPAAMLVGFAANPWTLRANPEINTTVAHLREVLGDEAYQSLARAGEAMTNGAMATYALDQIDLARTELT